MTSPRKAVAASQARPMGAVLNPLRAIPAQVADAFKNGKAKIVGGSLKASHPPVKNFERYPHFPVDLGNPDLKTTAYVIKGRVYARQEHARGSASFWYDCGRMPTAPIA
jgi:hypothetical protein